jgi:hypothetical protein
MTLGALDISATSALAPELVLLLLRQHFGPEAIAAVQAAKPNDLSHTVPPRSICKAAPKQNSEILSYILILLT